MKIGHPNTSAEYLQKTEHAVRHAYDGLDSCWGYYEEALQHSEPPIKKDGFLVWEPPKTPDEKAKLDSYLKLAGKYFDLKISEAMFAGFILQAAYTAIRLYSRNQIIPSSCKNIVQSSAKKRIIPFCIGRERHGLPTGLIVYAGRNQYCHWDEEKSHESTRRIFGKLSEAFFDSPLSDLAFDLTNPTIPLYAGEVLFTALGWDTYKKYLGEMTEILA